MIHPSTNKAMTKTDFLRKINPKNYSYEEKKIKIEDEQNTLSISKILWMFQ